MAKVFVGFGKGGGGKRGRGFSFANFAGKNVLLP